MHFDVSYKLISFFSVKMSNIQSPFFADISVLSNLPFLVYLDVSYNRLTNILDFDPPKNLMVCHVQYMYINDTLIETVMYVAYLSMGQLWFLSAQ